MYVYMLFTRVEKMRVNADGFACMCVAYVSFFLAYLCFFLSLAEKMRVNADGVGQKPGEPLPAVTEQRTEITQLSVWKTQIIYLVKNLYLSLPWRWWGGLCRAEDRSCSTLVSRKLNQTKLN